MAQKEEILKLSVVTDDETGLYHIGEVDGIFQKHQLRKFFKVHGLKGKHDMLEHLAYLSSQILQVWRESSEEDNACQAKQSSMFKTDIESSD